LAKASNAYNEGRFAEAYSLYKELALGGHGESQVFVGWMLLEGKGIASNPTEAAQWFERSASLGSPQGAFYWGRYLTLQGRHSDAFDWYQKSAEGNYIPGIFWVGYSLSEGMGVAQNIQKAYEFLRRAKAEGHLFACRQLALLDMRGYRGFAYRVFGVFSFILVVLSRTFLAENSERLRA
jgi:uncharacterized protein